MIPIFMNKTLNCPIPLPTSRQATLPQQWEGSLVNQNSECKLHKEHPFRTCRKKSPPFGGLGGSRKNASNQVSDFSVVSHHFLNVNIHFFTFNIH